MKINEYITESTENTISERPMGFVKQGLTSLGAKVLPGSLGAKMQGKLDTGKVANQLYKDFATFLGRSGQQATDDSLRTFLKQKGADKEIDIEKIIGQFAQGPAPVPESKKKIKEAVTLNRGALNKIFMNVAQALAASGGSGASASAAPAPGGSAVPKTKPTASAAPTSQPTAPSNAAPDASGNAPAQSQPAPATPSAPQSGGFKVDLKNMPQKPSPKSGFKVDLRNMPQKPAAPAPRTGFKTDLRNMPKPEPTPAAPQKDDWAARRAKAWGKGLAPGVHRVRAPTGSKVNEDQLDRLLTKITMKL